MKEATPALRVSVSRVLGSAFALKAVYLEMALWQKGTGPSLLPLLPGSQQQRPQRFPYPCITFLPITASSHVQQTRFENTQLKKGPQGDNIYVPRFPPLQGSVAQLKDSTQALFKAFKSHPASLSIFKNQETDPHNTLNQLPDVDGRIPKANTTLPHHRGTKVSAVLQRGCRRSTHRIQHRNPNR